MPTNPFETVARQRKTAALCRALRRLQRQTGIPDAQLYCWLERADDGVWRALARVADVHPPSEITRDAVLAEVRS